MILNEPPNHFEAMQARIGSRSASRLWVAGDDIGVIPVEWNWPEG
jgi:hypothetical protein